MVYLYTITKDELTKQQIEKGIKEIEVYCYNCNGGNTVDCDNCNEQKEYIEIYKCCKCENHTSWYDSGSSLYFESNCNDKNILCSQCNTKNLK